MPGRRNAELHTRRCGGCSWRLSPHPLALSLNPFPPSAAVPIGLSPLVPSPRRAHPHPPYPSFLSLGTVCPTESPDCPCFAALCRVQGGLWGHVVMGGGAQGRGYLHIQTIPLPRVKYTSGTPGGCSPPPPPPWTPLANGEGRWPPPCGSTQQQLQGVLGCVKALQNGL